MMKNISSAAEVKNAFHSAFASALQNNSQDEMIQAVETFAADLNAAMLAEHNSMSAEELSNTEALASRGVRCLTSEETKYYSALIGAMRAPAKNVKSALSDIDVTMPQTILDAVMEDVKTEFPLLAAVDFRNTSYLTTWLYNKQGRQLATWDEIGTAVTTELSGAFGKMDVTKCKLSAFMPISMDYLDLGAAWLDRYVRAILTEASGLAMETAVITGDGKTCPVGMDRNLTGGTTDTDGNITYPQKTATAITSLSPSVYGSIIAKLCKTETGRDRPVTDLIMVVNPVDYYSKVMPATTMILPTGGYQHDVLPVPTRIIQSAAMAEGKAIVGLAKQYLACLGAAKVNGNSETGVITYSDDVQFLQDNRVYKSRLLGNGRPKDNNAFELLDISGLTELTYRVKEVE